jgi:hypothetical protein
MKCPGFDKLIDYLDGRLGQKEARPIQEHLGSGCERCQADRNWYQELIAVVRSDDMVEPPAWLSKRALRLFAERKEEGIFDRLGRLIASLVLDSFAGPLAEGARSASSQSRQLLYRGGPYSIDVQIIPSAAGRANLIGQVLGQGETVAELPVRLARHGKIWRSAQTNSLGEFTLKEISQGHYDLFVETAHGTICLRELPVKLSR